MASPIATCMALLLVASTEALKNVTSPTTNISFDASKPPAAIRVPANFVGFGFETANFNNYSADFSLNLLESTAKRMSELPIIRIGGTSGDNLHVDPNQKSNVSCAGEPDCLFSSKTEFVLGLSYFEGFGKFKPYPMTFQAPLNETINITNTLSFVSRALENLGHDRLAAIAIGNEVHYEKTPQDYVRDADTLRQNITANLTNLDNRIFEVMDLGSGQVERGEPWKLSDAFAAGLDKDENTKFAAAHYYQIEGEDEGQLDLQRLLMNHSAITNKYEPYKKAIKDLQNDTDLRNISFVLSETGSSLQGRTNFSGGFGSCLWSIDFQLYGMSIGVARIAGTQRPTAKHALWTPNAIPICDDLPHACEEPQVRPAYYAQPFIADFIGNSTNAQSVVEQDLKSDIMTAYAMYDEDKLSRIALVNLKEWKKARNATQGSQDFDVAVPPQANSVVVRRLRSEAGSESMGFDVDPSQNITWAGEQWSFKVDNGKGHISGQVEEKVNVTNGKARVSVPDSEAAIVFLQ